MRLAARQQFGRLLIKGRSGEAVIQSGCLPASASSDVQHVPCKTSQGGRQRNEPGSSIRGQRLTHFWNLGLLFTGE